MADIDQLLLKNKTRLDKLADIGAVASPVRKKIVRVGATRPWQEHLPQYAVPGGEIDSNSGTNTVQKQVNSGTRNSSDLNNSDKTIPVQLPYDSGTKSPDHLSEVNLNDTEPAILLHRRNGSVTDKGESEIISGTIPVQNINSKLILDTYKDSSNVLSELAVRKVTSVSNQDHSHDPNEIGGPVDIGTENIIPVQIQDNSGTKKSNTDESQKDQLNQTSTVIVPEYEAAELSYGTKPVQKQLDSGTDPDQLRYKSGTNTVQFQNNSGTQTGTSSGTEFASKTYETEGVPSLQRVSPQQRILLEFIFQKAISLGGFESGPISSSEIFKVLAISVNSKEIAIKRLLRMGCISLVEVKRGPSGWASYKLHRFTYNELLQYNQFNPQVRGIQRTIGHMNSGTSSGTQTSTIPVPSSSSSFLIKETTTQGSADQPRNEESWSSIDFSALESIGFGKSHVAQILRKGKLTSEDLQNSIDYFAFDLVQNAKGKAISSNPLSFFMGIVGRGSIYTPPPNYENPRDKSRRLHLEHLKREEAMRQEREREIRTLEFKAWRNALSEARLIEISPEFGHRSGRALEVALEDYFERLVWPGLKQGTTSEVGTDLTQEKVRELITESLREIK